MCDRGKLCHIPLKVKLHSESAKNQIGHQWKMGAGEGAVGRKEWQIISIQPGEFCQCASCIFGSVHGHKLVNLWSPRCALIEREGITVGSGGKAIYLKITFRQPVLFFISSLSPQFCCLSHKRSDHRRWSLNAFSREPMRWTKVV